MEENKSSIARHRENAKRCFDKIEEDMMGIDSPEHKYRCKVPFLGKNALEKLLDDEKYSVEFDTVKRSKFELLPTHSCFDSCKHGEWMVITDNHCFSGKDRHIKIAANKMADIADQLMKTPSVAMSVPIKGRQELLQKLKEHGYTVKFYKGCQYSGSKDCLCGHAECSPDNHIDWMTITDPEPNYE
jgi:hypothetical protein